MRVAFCVICLVFAFGARADGSPASAGARADLIVPPLAKPTKAAKTSPSGLIATAWRTLPESGSGCADEDLSFDYGSNGGMRNVFCRGLLVLSWNAFLAQAPTTPFLKGPHKGKKLNLQSEREFGRYNPEFVRWAVRALVPASDDTALRDATRPIYDAQLKTLARIYFLVDKALGANPAWVEQERKRYLNSMDAKGGSWNVFELTDPYHDVLGTSDVNWNGHDPNLVRSATMWWLRRAHDGTRPLWGDGLNRLLTTYDELWLRDQQNVKPHPLPRTTKPDKGAPEYR